MQPLDRRIARLAEAEGVEPRRALRQLFEKRFPEAPRQRVPVPPGRLDQRTFEPAAMRVRLLQTIDVEPEALADLARSRSERVVNLLTDRGVDADRLSTTISAAAEAGIERTPAPAAVFELLSRSAADGS